MEVQSIQLKSIVFKIKKMKKITKYLLWSIGSISASATLAGLTYYLLNRKKDSMYKIPVKDVSNLEKINVLSNELSKKTSRNIE